jgi:hypothetical protein
MDKPFFLKRRETFLFFEKNTFSGSLPGGLKLNRGLGGYRQTLERQSQKAESIVGWSAGAVRRRGPNGRDSSHV